MVRTCLAALSICFLASGARATFSPETMSLTDLSLAGIYYPANGGPFINMRTALMNPPWPVNIGNINNLSVSGTLGVTSSSTFNGTVQFGSSPQNVWTITPGTNASTETRLSSTVGSLQIDSSEAANSGLEVGNFAGSLGTIATFLYGAGGNTGDGATGNKVTVNNLFQSQFYRTPGNTYTLSGSSVPSILSITSNWTGTSTANPAAFNGITVSSDTVSGGVLSAFAISHSFGGGSAGGTRNSLLVQLGNNGGATASSSTGVAGSFWTTASANAGVNSAWYGTNPQVVSANGASVYGIFGSEEDVAAQSGSSIRYKSAHTFINLSNDRVQGSLYDTAIGFASQTNTASSTVIGWLNGISFGRADGQYPMDPGGTLIGEYRETTNAADGTVPYKRMVLAHGFYQPDVQFTTDSINVPAFTVSGAGVATHGGLSITPNSTGAVIDVTLKQLTASSISAAGTNYIQGEDVYDANGNSWTLTTVSGGVPSAITLRNMGFITGSAPSNPVATTNGHGSGLTITETWTTPTKLTIGGLTDDVIVGGGTQFGALNATVGFMHLPYTNATSGSGGIPTGTPASTNGPACEWNDVTFVLNCYSPSAGAWKHVSFSASAG